MASSDISKCNGEGCWAKDRCWRHVAPDTPHQSYNKYEPEGKPFEQCKDFMELPVDAKKASRKGGSSGS